MCLPLSAEAGRRRETQKREGERGCKQEEPCLAERRAGEKVGCLRSLGWKVRWLS